MTAERRPPEEFALRLARVQAFVQDMNFPRTPFLAGA